MRRLRFVLPLAVVLAIVVAVVALQPLAWLDGDGEVAAADGRARGEIAVATLSTTNEADGAIASALLRPVVSATPGTVTSIGAAGTIVEPGVSLFTTDERPTIALPGSTPSWRELTIDDAGPDVEQLETALVALGYDPDGGLTVDDTFTAVTATVVERWQDDVGLDPTGVVGLGSVVFVPEGASISSVVTTIGQPTAPGETILVLTTGERQLEATIAADQRSLIDVGTIVSARLPDRSMIDGSVTDIVATGGGSWLVTAALDRGGTPLPDGDSVPVTITWTEIVVAEATTVPASALSRLDSGAYALEVVDGETTRFVEVEIGESSGSTVEIITDLAPGTTIISP